MRFNGVIKGWVQVNQPPGLRLTYSGLYASLSTTVKDIYLENKINGNKNKASKQKLKEIYFLERGHVFNTNTSNVYFICMSLRCHMEKVTA